MFSKIKEVDSISGDDGCCLSSATEDPKYFHGKGYMACEFEISSTRFPSETQRLSHESSHQIKKPYKCDICNKQFT